MVCWFAEQSSLAVGDRYRIQHTSRSVLARVENLDYRLDVNTLHRDETATSLSLNEIGRIRLRAQAPADVRRLPAQPGHRRFHPGGPGHQQHGRRPG